MRRSIRLKQADAEVGREAQPYLYLSYCFCKEILKRGKIDKIRPMSDFLTCKTYSGSYVADGRFAYPGSVPHYAPDRTFDTRHIRLELALDFGRKTLKGRCVTTLVAIADGATEMVFDAVNFKDVKVTAKGRPLKLDYTGRQIKIHWASPVKLGTTVELAISYRVAKPKLGLHFIGPDRHYPDKPIQAWTQGEDEYNRYWFP